MTDALIKSVAAEWDCSPDQLKALYALVIDRGSMTGNERDDLLCVAVAYSTACRIHECSDWLPFDVMPNWEDDVFCILEDEEQWKMAVDLGTVRLLATTLRKSRK